MTLQEALDTDISATVNYIKSHMSVPDGERLEKLFETLKFHAEHSNIPGFHKDFDFDNAAEQTIQQMQNKT